MANLNDPRFQRALQEQMAQRTFAGVPSKLTEGLISRFAGNQFRQQLAFQDLAIQKQRHKDFLGLDNKRLAFQRKVFDKEMDIAQDRMKWGIGLGLGTSVLAGLLGRHRAKKTKALRDSVLGILKGEK